MKTICDLHNEIVLNLKEAAKALLREKEKLAKNKNLTFFALALKRVAGLEGLIEAANNKAMRMESALHLRKKIMEEHGIEHEYQKKKKKMNEGGFYF